MTEKNSVFVIAIDGQCASGKTTLAESLAKKTGAGVIHMDDFFLPAELRTEERLGRPGGNVHYERFMEEVLPFLRSREGFSYRRFDCRKMEMSGTRQVKGSGLYIVEGAYSCHPALGKYMDWRIFSQAEEKIRLQRILRRNGREALRSFQERWIPLEEAYFQAYHIREQADAVIDGTF